MRPPREGLQHNIIDKSPWTQLRIPWDLTFETPNLCVSLFIQRGINVYARNTYASFPFVLCSYTPLFHYIVAIFPIDGTNPFFYGRVLALSSFVGLALLIMFSGKSKVHVSLCLLLAVAFLSIWPVTSNSAFLKNDSLGILLSVSGMLVAWRSRSDKSLTLAALLAVSAVATKQSLVVAAAATAVYLWVRDKTAFAKYLLLVGSIGAIAAIWASIHFGSGFWFSVIQSERQPLEFTNGVYVLRTGFAQPLAFIITLSAAATVFRRLYAVGPVNLIRQSPLEAYFVLAFLQLLITCWKLGASTNYLIEPLWAACFVLRQNQDAVPTQRWSPYAAITALVVGAAALTDLVVAKPAKYSFVAPEAIARRAGEHAEYMSLVSRTGLREPRILDLASHLERFSVGANPILNDPWAYGSLWQAGILSPDSLIATIRAEDYDLIILPDWYEHEGKLIVWSQRIRAAVLEMYEPRGRDSVLESLIFVRKSH